MIRSSGGEGFHDHRGPLPAANAGGAQAVPPAAAAQGMEQVEGEAGAAGPERVAQGYGAAVHIGTLTVEAELPLDGQVLRGERLVDLDQIHVIERQARGGKR